MTSFYDGQRELPHCLGYRATPSPSRLLAVTVELIPAMRNQTNRSTTVSAATWPTQGSAATSQFPRVRFWPAEHLTPQDRGMGCHSGRSHPRQLPPGPQVVICLGPVGGILPLPDHKGLYIMKKNHPAYVIVAVLRRWTRRESSSTYAEQCLGRRRPAVFKPVLAYFQTHAARTALSPPYGGPTEAV